MIRVLDTSVLINLFNGQVIKTALSNGQIYAIGPSVQQECDDDILQYIYDENIPLKHLNDDSIPADAYINLKTKMNLGSGEAECIAYGSIKTNSILYSDDKKARNYITKVFGENRLSGSIGILMELSKMGILTDKECFEAYQKMIKAGAFLPAMTQRDFK
ncbi:hypothetical protein [Sneathiella glossodoripedis]|uniref:hypothetical protein n=1 Tax=Sneathiella glossodoripedis TaxID=418853 RepID=UPI000471AB7F|nr:hypothetical protein [Sneathiella glossodoripedis]